jgi:hypothetical protein
MFAGPAWHGPCFEEAIEGVTAADAAARPIAAGHSIFELTHHIGAWIGEVESRLRGNRGGQPADGDWPAASATVDETTWREVVGRVRARHAALLSFLESFDGARLHAAVEPSAANPASRGVTGYVLLNGLAQHNAYHIGQIVLLRKGVA